MSRIHWPEGTEFKAIVLEPEQGCCTLCGHRFYVCYHKNRRLRSLEGPLQVISKIRHCPVRLCDGYKNKQESNLAADIAPPHWTVSWDLFAWMGHRRYARHWSTPQIRAELRDSFGIEMSADVVEDYTAKYEVMLAARQSDSDRLAREYRQVDDLILTIDGLQPEKGHETLYVVRELRRQRVWFAEALLSSAEAEVRRLFERTRQMCEGLGKPVRCWMSDKQDAFVKGVDKVFPGVPHRLCANHFLRDAAKVMLEADSHAKVQMRRKVRGLRSIEREMLANQAEVSASPGPSAAPEPVNVPSSEPAAAARSGAAPLDGAAPALGEGGSRESDEAVTGERSGAPPVRARDAEQQQVAAPVECVAEPTGPATPADVQSHGPSSQRSTAEADLVGKAVAECSACDTTPSLCVEPAGATKPPDCDDGSQVVLDYCAAVRGILNDSQGGPLHPPGLRMSEALGEVDESIKRASMGKKGGPTNGRSTG